MKVVCTKWGKTYEFIIELLLELLYSGCEAALEVSRFADEQGEQTLWNLNPKRTGLEVRSPEILFPGCCNNIVGK